MNHLIILKKQKKISKQMIEKYVPMVREALEEVAPYYKDKKEFQVILENAELYIQDAEKFLEDGQDEVAILSIGYADGLSRCTKIGQRVRAKNVIFSDELKRGFRKEKKNWNQLKINSYCNVCMHQIR